MELAFTQTEFGAFYYVEADLIGRALARGEFWDAHLRPWIDAVPKGKTLVDVGACLGFFTIYAALRGVQVAAFEPCPELFGLLEQNVAANGVERLVTRHRTALYDERCILVKNRKQTLSVYPELPDGRMDFEKVTNSGQLCLLPSKLAPSQPGPEPYLLEASRLDDFSFADVALIKTDAQGCDLRILEGGRETIRRHRPVICTEFEAELAVTHDDTRQGYLEFFAGIGYEVVAELHPDPGRYDTYVEFVAVPK